MSAQLTHYSGTTLVANQIKKGIRTVLLIIKCLSHILFYINDVLLTYYKHIILSNYYIMYFLYLSGFILPLQRSARLWHVYLMWSRKYQTPFFLSFIYFNLIFVADHFGLLNNSHTIETA